MITRRRIRISALVAFSILGVAALFTTVALRLGYLEHFLLSRVQTKLGGYGARVEIGSLKSNLRRLSVDANDLRFYVEGAKEPFATIKTLAVSVTLREILGLSGPTEISVRECTIEGLRARYEVDENGRSNLDGLHASTILEERFTVIYSAAMTTVHDAEFTYLDRLHKLDGTARNLTIALSPAENGAQRLIASSRESEFVYDGRAAKGLDLDLNALVREQGATVESLAVRSQLLTADLKGELKSWRTFDYQLEGRADLRLRDVGYLLAPHLRLAGSAQFEGRVDGSGADYRATGRLRGENLVARDVQLRGLNLAGSLSGKGQDAAGRAELAIGFLKAAGFVVNRFSAIGDFVGSSAGFSWQGIMRAGDFAGERISGKGITVTAARVSGPFDDPARIQLTGDARIATLITADVPIGSVTSDVAATADEVEFPNFRGAFFGGEAKGRARVRLDGRGQSEIATDLSGLDIDQAMAAAFNKRLPLRGKASGRIDLRWPGGNYRRADGTIKLDFAGDALGSQQGVTGLPVNGKLSLIASQGRMRLDDSSLQTGATELKANGTLGWDRTGDLSVILTTADAAELQSLVEDFSDAIDSDSTRALVGNLHEYEIQLAGGLRFQGRVIGEVARPQVQGRFALDSVNVGSEQLGQISGDLDYRSDALHLANTRVTQTGGGTAELSLDYPFEVENGASLRARLDKIALAPLARFFVDAQIAGRVTGNAELAGLPAAMRGTAEVTVDEAKYEGRSIEQVRGRFQLEGTRIDSRDVNLRVGGGTITGSGWFDTKTKGYSVSLNGEGLDVAKLVNSGRDVPIDLAGHVDVKLEAESALFKRDEKDGRVFDRLTASISSPELQYSKEPLGAVKLSVNGRDSIAAIDFAADLIGHRYSGAGTIDFTQRDAPVRFSVELRDVALGPIFDVFGNKSFSLPGTVAGELRVAGNLFGEQEPVRLEAELSTLKFESNEARLAAQPPVLIKLQGNQIDFGRVHLSGTDTSLDIAGTFAIGEKGRTALTANGDINLRLLQNFVREVTSEGIVHVQITATGEYPQPRLSGSATVENAALRSREFPLALTKGRGRLLFTANQAQIASFTGDVGGGELSLTGGATLVGLVPDRWRLQARLNAVRIDYPQDFRTTADGELVLQGGRRVQLLSGLLNVRRAEYLAETDLFDLIERFMSEFGTGAVGTGVGDSVLPPTQLDMRVVANDSLVINNKSLDLVASADLRLRGSLDDPVFGGRLTISRGLIDDLFKERYRITSGVIEFPGVGERPPRLSVEAETEISGYRLTVLIAGPFDNLRITPRSEPPLPQADVIALMTSGSLPREGLTGDSPSRSLAQTQAGNLSTLLTQPLSSRIGSNVTGRLFGLNRFSIDPLSSGRGSDPSARVTVGRRVTRDLSITYSTSLGSNQDQVFLIEYRASDRLSFVASRAQDGAFGLDVRLRKRF